MPIISEDKAELEQHIRKRFPGKELLRIKDIKDMTGISDYRTLHKMFKFTNGHISVSNTAQSLLKCGS